MYEKVSNQRKDFLHKLSNSLVKENDTLCIETLSITDLLKTKKFNQSLMDSSLSMFKDFLEYKVVLDGKNLLKIGQFEPSSKTCSCGVINNNLKLSDRVWTCADCNTTHDRDILAANNVKRFAFLNLNTVGTTGIQACGDSVLESKKQEVSNNSSHLLISKNKSNHN